MFKFRFHRSEKQSDSRERKAKPILVPAKPPHLTLNSSVLRALEQVAPGAESEEIRTLLQEHKPSLVGEFDRIIGLGRQKPMEALQSIQRKEAIDMLGALHKISHLADERKAAAFLPIPPHISEHVLYFFDQDLVFATDDHLPPHLAHIGYGNLGDLLPRDLIERFTGIEALLLEGFIRRGSLLIRKNALCALQTLGRTSITLFLHSLPHMPHHSAFEAITDEYNVIELL